MPIVNVQILIDDPAEFDSSGLARRIADRLGDVFGSGPAETWVRLTLFPAAHYAENHSDLLPPLRPVFVEVLRAESPTTARLAVEARAVAEVVADILGRPRKHIHILYEPPASGRIAFGGEINR